ncbi:MAG: hypothetical protein KGD64_05120 [Candidatus Heimdallarchaeota archaeon]|nr:hypothetical protein [Candidatus Heimdallarchaeota archaeon]
MTKFQVYSTEDLIILESKKQAIAAIGFSLSKQENKPFSNLSDSIIGYLNSFGYSYVIRITKSYTRFFLLITAKNSGDVINKVSKVLSKMEKLSPIAQQLVISPLNHSIIMGNLPFNPDSTIKNTKNPRILNIDNKYWLIYSLIIGKQEKNYFTKFLKSLLSLKTSTLNLNVKYIEKTKKSNTKKAHSVLITHSFNTKEECENFLNRIKQISIQYNERFSCTLRFHTAGEVKQNIYSIIFGLSPINQPEHNWYEVLKIERFVPVLANYDPELVENEESEVHQNLIAIETGSKITMLEEKQLENKEILDKDLTIPNVNQKDSLISFGKRVSKEEIDELLENIPVPPA